MVALKSDALSTGDQTTTTEVIQWLEEVTSWLRTGHCCVKRTESEQEKLSTGLSIYSCATLKAITHYEAFHIYMTLFQKHGGLCSSIDVPHKHHRLV